MESAFMDRAARLAMDGYGVPGAVSAGTRRTDLECRMYYLPRHPVDRHAGARRGGVGQTGQGGNREGRRSEARRREAARRLSRQVPRTLARWSRQGAGPEHLHAVPRLAACEARAFESGGVARGARGDAERGCAAVGEGLSRRASLSCEKLQARTLTSGLRLQTSDFFTFL